jgi:nitroreductase
MSINPTNRSVLPAIADRWSPYRFNDQIVEDDKILTCLEAARWAASSYNDQPWSWIIARRQDAAAFSTMIGCLLEANQVWANHAGVLMISVMRNTFGYNQKPNRVALHDLGAAATHMALQATTLGLQIHQMAGLNLSQSRQTYGIPDGHEPQTAIAIGYPDLTAPQGAEAIELQNRQSGPRMRRPLHELVFQNKWGQSTSWVK